MRRERAFVVGRRATIRKATSACRDFPGAVREMVKLVPLTAGVLLFAVPFVLLRVDPFQWCIVRSAWLRVLLFVALGLAAWLTAIVMPDKLER